MATKNHPQSSESYKHTYIVLNQHPTDETDQEDGYTMPGTNDDSNVENDGSIIIDKFSSSSPLPAKPRFSDLTLRVASALFYAACSFLITIVNKIVLTTYGFPSNVLGVGQMIAIIVILKFASILNLVKIRQVSLYNKKLWILAAFYLGNLVTGLGGTKHLPLPIFIALRRFSIALTAIGEYYVLNVKQSFRIICTIIAMIGGSLIAAASDLTFNAIGYLLVISSVFFTSGNGIYTKKTIDSHEINNHEILFYNALLTVLPMMLICCFTDGINAAYNFAYWADIGFIVSFLASCTMGYLLMFSIVLSTQYNSALTTTIVGTIKNILTTYVGMYIGGDYRYNALNFLGLNVSLIGSLFYTYFTFSVKSNKAKEVQVKV